MAIAAVEFKKTKPTAINITVEKNWKFHKQADEDHNESYFLAKEKTIKTSFSRKKKSANFADIAIRSNPTFYRVNEAY